MSYIVVCESRGDWARAFRQIGLGDQLIETRHLDGCSAVLDRFPQGMTAVVVDPSQAKRASVWLSRVRQRHCQAAHLAIVDHRHQELGWWLRESGVTHVLTSRLDLFRAEPLIRKHLERIVAAPLSLDERIWNNLPWSRAIRSHRNEQ